MKISITCVANGNSKQSLLFRTVRSKRARGRNKSLQPSLRLKRLVLSRGEGGVLSSQAQQAERQTGVCLFPGNSGCFNHLPKSISQHQTWRGKRKNREGGPKPLTWHAQQVAVWHVSDATSTRKAAFSPSALIEKIIKTFSFKNIWHKLLPKLGGHSCMHLVPTEKGEFNRAKTQEKPHRLSSWLPKRVLKELVLWVRGTPRSTL